MGRSLFLTGAAGYVGSRFLARLEPGRFERVVCLLRRPDSLPAELALRPDVEVCVADLLEPERYAGALAGCDAIVHLAAVTGKAPRRVYFRTNVDGTRALLEAARAAGVSDFVHTSSVAAGFADQTRYWYAHSKAESERCVAQSGLRFLILRPTIVIGPGAPVLQGLARLATAPLVPVFGDGRACVQPVCVDDLVDVLLAAAAADGPRGRTLEVGGPDRLGIEEFLLAIRELRGAGPARVVHLPLAPVRAALGLVEPFLLPLLPLTAGQLASFANDGSAQGDDASGRRRVRDVLAEDAAAWRADTERELLERECRRLGRYLAGRPPDPYVVDQYVRFHARRPEALRPDAPFGRALLALACLGGPAAALADCYASRFETRGALRGKLVVLIGLLECTSGYERFDTPYRGGRLLVWAKLAGRGALEALGLLAATLLLGPLHALAWLAARRGGRRAWTP